MQSKCKLMAVTQVGALSVLMIGAWCSVAPFAWAQQLFQPEAAPDGVFEQIEERLKAKTNQDLRVVVAVDEKGNVMPLHHPDGEHLSFEEYWAELNKGSEDEVNRRLKEERSSRIVLELYGYNPGCAKLGGDDCFSNGPRG